MKYRLWRTLAKGISVFALEPQTKPRGIMGMVAIVGMVFFAIFACDLLSYIPSPSSDVLILKAKSWNSGQVHIWNNLRDDESTRPTDLPSGTKCDRLDSTTYRSPLNPPIYYYRVNCDGVTGYVEIDQVR